MQNEITERYYNAIELVKSLCESETAIRRTQFCEEHKLQKQFFAFLIQLKAIQEIVSERKEGAIFKFTHTQASNESKYFLAHKVLDCIRAYQQERKQDKREKDKKEQQERTANIILNSDKQKQQQQTQQEQTQTTLTKQTAEQYLISEAQQEIDEKKQRIAALNQQIIAFQKQIDVLQKSVDKKQSLIELLKEC